MNSVGSYLAMWTGMALALGLSWWLALPLAALAGVLLVRVFIIFHDCGHGSFFSSRTANDLWGFATGVLTWKRAAYRMARNPMVLLLVAPLQCVIEHRVPSARANARERRSVWLTTLCIVLWGAAWSQVLGFLPYLILQPTDLAVAGAIGVWLFYSQHQFEAAYRRTGNAWSYEDAALRGSAFLKLPRMLQWLTGNIGYHHIHHLNSRIPNYNLQACHDSHPLLQSVAPVSMSCSIRAFELKLWDEASERLIRFRQLGRGDRGFA